MISLIYSRAAYRALITRRIFSIQRNVTSSAKVMASQPDPGVVILPRSLLDTDFYKARTSDIGDVSCHEHTVITQLSSLPTAHDAAGRAAPLPRGPNNVQVLPPRCQHILHPTVLRAIRCEYTLCAHIPASAPISLCRHTRGQGSPPCL